MRKILLLSIFIAVGIMAYAQSQLDNSGFEAWEDVGLPEQEPVDWSSIKTSPYPVLNNSAPIIWAKSTDAHSGNYSVKLFNVYVSLIGTVAAGTITNGRVNSNVSPEYQYIYTDISDSDWHSTFTTRPDSVTGWYKYFPLEDDSGQIRVLLHRGEAQIPYPGIPENWVAMAFFKTEPDTAQEWTRFSVPFEYYSEAYPEYALAIFNSGNGFNAKENSIMYIDDIEMIYNIPVGLTEIQDPEFRIYIDRSGYIRLSGTLPGEYQTLRIMDLAGRTVMTAIISSDQADLSSAGLNRGVYLISLENGKERFVQKIIIE